MVRLSKLLLTSVWVLLSFSSSTLASSPDTPRRGQSKEIAIISEVKSPQNPDTSLELTTGVVETVDFADLHSRRYLYYLNDYFERESDQKTEPLRVSLWLRGFNFGTQQSKREKAMRLCAFMVRPEVNKRYVGSFDEVEYGAEFALEFFKELCTRPLEQIEAFEDCQARLSRSYLPWGRTIRPACDKETQSSK